MSEQSQPEIQVRSARRSSDGAGATPRVRGLIRLRPYLMRKRWVWQNLDWRNPDRTKRFFKNVTEMLRVFEKQRVRIRKNVNRQATERLIITTLEAAADHRLEWFRRLVALRDRRRSIALVKPQMRRIDELAEAISKLPPASIRGVNQLIAAHASQFFDTETLTSIITAVGEATKSMSPGQRTGRVHDAIYDPTTLVVRTAPSELIDGWEMLPAAIRTAVEADMRRSKRVRTAIQFLRHLNALLMKHAGAKRGHPPSPNRRYVKFVGKRWLELGLTLGLANHAAGGKRSSLFQQFCNAALAAVRDRTLISGQDVKNARRDLGNPKGVKRKSLKSRG